MSQPTRLDVAELRRAFDRSFVSEIGLEADESRDFLAIRLSGARYAVASSEVQGVAALGKVTRVPSPARELLGLTGVRGQLVPLFSLAGLIGSTLSGASRWLLLVGRGAPVGLAFDELDAYRSVPVRQVVQYASPSAASSFSQELVTLDAGLVPVISVSAALAMIGKSGARSADKER